MSQVNVVHIATRDEIKKKPKQNKNAIKTQLKKYMFLTCTGCGSVVNNELKSPGYPSNYPNSIHCVYRVPIPYDRKLDIYFSDFHLESHSFCG